MRLGSTGWPQIGQLTVPLESETGCSSSRSAPRPFAPRVLCPASLAFGPFPACGPFLRWRLSLALIEVFVPITYHPFSLIACNKDSRNVNQARSRLRRLIEPMLLELGVYGLREARLFKANHLRSFEPEMPLQFLRRIVLNH